jgi:ABC-2 type transport system ATP-binding protein
MEYISVQNATKRFRETTALDGVSVSFEEGKIHGLVGRNGSGKTVLLKAICGFMPLTSGTVTVAGKSIGKNSDVPDDIGIIIETPGFLPNYSALNNLKFLAAIQKKITIAQIRETIALVGLDPASRKHVGKFSMGMRQRLGIAQAIMENPTLLILDEPFNGLDIAGVEQMRGLLLNLKEVGKTILLASHYKEDVEKLCETVRVLDNGKVIEERL